jgi:hypothetical protein
MFLSGSNLDSESRTCMWIRLCQYPDISPTIVYTAPPATPVRLTRRSPSSRRCRLRSQHPATVPLPSSDSPAIFPMAAAKSLSSPSPLRHLPFSPSPSPPPSLASSCSPSSPSPAVAIYPYCVYYVLPPPWSVGDAPEVLGAPAELRLACHALLHQRVGSKTAPQGDPRRAG